MRTLNVKRAVVFLVVVIVVAGSTHLLHSFQLQRTALTFFSHAEALWKEIPRDKEGAIQPNPETGRLISEAIRLMNSYLAQKPHDIDASQELGFWYAETGGYAAASTKLAEVLRALEHQTPPDLPRIQEVRWKLIRSAIAPAQPRWGDAVDDLQILKSEKIQISEEERKRRKNLPDDAQVLCLLGKCLIKLGQEEGRQGKGDADSAIENFSKAIELAPDRVDIYYQKAMTLQSVQKPDAADACMAQMVAYWDKPPSKDKTMAAGAHHLYGQWLMEHGKYPEALKQAEATLAIEKDHAGGLYLAGQMQLELQNSSKAEEYAKRGMEVVPQNTFMYTLMADILVRNHQQDKAIDVFKRGIDTVGSTSGKALILWHLANLYLDSRRSEDAKSIAAAEDCIKRMREYHVQPEQVAFLEARMAYANDDWKAAREGFEKVRAQLGDFPQLMKCLDYWTGYCYVQQGNPDEAMHAFQRSLSFDKFYFKAHDGIARIFIENDQLKEAVREYRQAVSGNPTDPDAWQAFARTLLLFNLRRSPEEQNWEEVTNTLVQAERIAPNSGQIKLLIAELLVAQGRKGAEKAADIIRDLRDSVPQNIDFWIAQVNLLLRQGQVDEAKKLLDEAQEKLGDQVTIRLARVPFVLRELGLQAGEEIDKLAANVDAFPSKEKTRLWRGLEGYLTEIKEYDRAKQLCRQIAKEEPHDAPIRYRLLELALKTHDARDPAASLAELDRVLDEIDKIAGRGPLWLCGKAVRLKLEALHGKPQLLDAAMDYAAQAQKQRVSWSRPHVLQGEICLKQGHDEEALQHYLQASANGDRDLQDIRVLLKMLLDRQRYQEAEQVIARLDSNQTPLTTDIEKEKTELYIFGRGSFDRALEYSNIAYDPNSDDYRDHIWHGQVLKILARRAQQEGHQDKLSDIAQRAEKSLRRACQLAPNAPECHVALVQLLVAANQRKQAEIAASDAEEMIPLDTRPLAMGHIYDALGETQKAGQSYEKAFKLRPDLPLTIRLLADFYVRNKDFQHATPLIDQLLSSNESSESDKVIARRMKVRSILVNEGYPKLKEANDLIDFNLKSSQASSQDTRLKVRLLLADPSQARGPQVLKLAESLIPTSGAEPEPDDRFQLAQMYLARSNWERCRDQMEKLVNGGQCDPRYMAAYVRMLLDQDQLNDAELWLDKLEKVSNTTTAESVGFRAEWMFRLKKWGEVPGFVSAYVSQEKAEPKDRLDRTLVAAKLLEDLGNRLTAPTEKRLAQLYFDKACEWYESYSKQRKQGQMILAAFYARHGKIPAALDLLNQFGGKASPTDLRNAAVAITRCETVSAEQLQQVEKLLDSTAAALKQPLPLLNALIVLKISQGKFDDAEDLCRQIIAKDPKNYLAYNNLGVLLALSRTKLDEALDMVNRAIELVGPLPLLLDSRAVVRMARSEPEPALEDLASITTDKAEPVWLFHKARALMLAGQTEGAITAMADAHNKGLERAMIDPPERPLFDELQEQLTKHNEQN